MKTTLLTLIFYLVIFQMKAQQISLVADPVARPSEATLNSQNWEDQKLRSDLTLSEDQYGKVKEITAERASARRIVNEMFKLEPNKKEARLREIDKQFDWQFEEVLNAKQYKKYLKLEGRDKAIAQENSQMQPADPNFNAQVQAMIAKVRKPAINPALLPKQDTLATEKGLASDTLQNIVPAGLDPLAKPMAPASLVTREDEKAAQPEKQEISLAIPDKANLSDTNNSGKENTKEGRSSDPGKSRETLEGPPQINAGD